MNGGGYGGPVRPVAEPRRPGGWPDEAASLLEAVLLGIPQMSRLHFRQDVLQAMGRSPGARDIHLDVEELGTARAHVREILSTVGRHGDARAALDALCAALGDQVPYDSELPWLRLTVLAVTADTGLPAGKLLSIIRLLRDLTPRPSAEQLRRHLPRAAAGLALLPPEASLPEILERLLDRRGAPDPTQALEFLHALGADPELAGRDELRWVRELLGRSAGGPAEPCGPATRLIVQVRVEPESPAHLDRTRYQLWVSYYRQPLTGGRFERVDTLPVTASLAEDELITEGSTRLAGWSALSRAMRAVVGDAVRIEFLLPAALLGHSAELWASRYGSGFGLHHPVVVRSLERYADPIVHREAWHERWRHVSAEDGDAVDRIVCPPLVHERPSGLTEWLSSWPTLACIALDTPYEELAPQAREAVVDAIMYGGIPAILWRRVAGDPAEMFKALREHGLGSLGRLPETVHAHRRNTRGDDRGGIALLWDDPDCVDPDQDAPFAGMV